MPASGTWDIYETGLAGFVLGGQDASLRENRSRFPFGLLRSTYDRTLAACSHCSARKRRLYLEAY